MTASSKSVQEQVREIQKLIQDANETLDQANWALQTLEFRLRQEEAAPPEPPDR